MYHYLKPILNKKPDYLIVHIGTNDTQNYSSQEIVDEILNLKLFIKKELPESKITISLLINRNDNAKANEILKHVNKQLSQLQIDVLDNSNITVDHLGKKRFTSKFIWCKTICCKSNFKN